MVTIEFTSGSASERGHSYTNIALTPVVDTKQAAR